MRECARAIVCLCDLVSYPLGDMGLPLVCDCYMYISFLFPFVPLVSSLLHYVCIGVAPITQYTHVRIKNSNAQESSPYVVKVISIP